MKTPLNLGALPPVSAPLSAVLQDPARHLSVAVDPDLAFGRVLPRGNGQVVTTMPALLLLMRGALCLSCDGSPVPLVAGATAAQIASGCRLDYTAAEDCEIIVIADPRLACAGAVLPIDLNAPMAPSSPPSPSVLLSPTPDCAIATMQETPLISVGLWSASPYARRAVPMAVSEIMYLLEGSVLLSTPDGQSFRFEAGDALLAPHGADLAWDNATKVRKLFISAQIQTAPSRS